MKATLKFQDRLQAEAFATDWGRYSKGGHVIGAGIKNVEVTVFNVTELTRLWIDNYILNINTPKN